MSVTRPDASFFGRPNALPGADAELNAALIPKQRQLDAKVRYLRAKFPHARIEGALAPKEDGSEKIAERFNCLDCPANGQYGIHRVHSNFRRHLQYDNHSKNVTQRIIAERAGNVWVPTPVAFKPADDTTISDLQVCTAAFSRAFPESHFDSWAEKGRRGGPWECFICFDCGDELPFYANFGQDAFFEHLMTPRHERYVALDQWRQFRDRHISDPVTGSITGNGIHRPILRGAAGNDGNAGGN